MLSGVGKGWVLGLAEASEASAETDVIRPGRTLHTADCKHFLIHHSVENSGAVDSLCSATNQPSLAESTLRAPMADLFNESLADSACCIPCCCFFFSSFPSTFPLIFSGSIRIDLIHFESALYQIVLNRCHTSRRTVYSKACD